MNTKVIILIQSNPIESHRPSEGIRMALGLAACNHLVDIILLNQASLLLSNKIEYLVDGENAQKYLAELKEYLTAFFVDKETVEETINLSDEYKVVSLSRHEIAQKIAAAACFVRF